VSVFTRLREWFRSTERRTPKGAKVPQDHFAPYVFHDPEIGRLAHASRGMSMAANVAFVQASRIGSAQIASGTAGSIAAPSVGHCVTLCIQTNSDTQNDVSSVATSMGTFQRVGSYIGPSGQTALNQEWWICFNVTTSTGSITVTSGSGGGWWAMAYEWTGVQACSPTFSINVTLDTAVDATALAVPAGSALISSVTLGSTPTWTGSSPWVDYGLGLGTIDMAYQTVSSASTPTVASWSNTETTGGSSTIILFPNVSPIACAGPLGATGVHPVMATGTGYLWVPSGVSSIVAKAWGSGGSGGQGGSSSGSAGGGGGEFAEEPTLAVTSGSIISFTVAAEAAESAGSTSTVVGSSVTVTANGGSQGLGSSGGAGGTGSSNTTHFNGGAGAGPGTTGGGGGGGSGGTASAGNNGTAGSTSTGGAGAVAVTGGGPGGAGGNLSNQGAPAASGPGGGGGGGAKTDETGGDGTSGQVTLSWATTVVYGVPRVFPAQAVTRASVT
jgi:hypothetical protein